MQPLHDHSAQSAAEPGRDVAGDLEHPHPAVGAVHRHDHSGGDAERTAHEETGHGAPARDRVRRITLVEPLGHRARFAPHDQQAGAGLLRVPRDLDSRKTVPGLDGGNPLPRALSDLGRDPAFEGRERVGSTAVMAGSSAQRSCGNPRQHVEQRDGSPQRLRPGQRRPHALPAGLGLIRRHHDPIQIHRAPPQHVGRKVAGRG